MKPKDFERQWKAKVGKNPVAADWQSRIEEIERETLAVRPPNSFTAVEYAALRNISRNKAAETLNRWHRLGKAVRHKVPGSCRVYFTLT